MRPMSQGGMTHDIEEEERRFAHQIVEWLQENAKAHEIDHLVIFTSPRMLGELRKTSSGLLTGHLKELEGNLMRLDAGQLAEHRMVRDLLPEVRVAIAGRRQRDTRPMHLSPRICRRPGNDGSVHFSCTSSEAARTAEQFRTWAKRSGKWGEDKNR